MAPCLLPRMLLSTQRTMSTGPLRWFVLIRALSVCVYVCTGGLKLGLQGSIPQNFVAIAAELGRAIHASFGPTAAVAVAHHRRPARQRAEQRCPWWKFRQE